MADFRKISKRWLAIFVVIALIVHTHSAQAAWLAEKPLAEKIKQKIEQRTTENISLSSQYLQVDGMQRSYQLYIPSSARQSARPVVIALHGGGGNANQMLKRWQAIAQQQNFILVAPQGIGANSKMGTWNAYGCCGQAMQKQVNDIQFIQAVLKDASQHALLDSHRIYVVGFSNGGMLTHQLAIHMGRQLAAVAIVSGALFGDEATAKDAVPILIIHGEKDSVVPFQGGISPTRFVAKAQQQPFQSVAYAMHYWKTVNQCQTKAFIEQTAHFNIEKNLGCQADVVLYDVDQGQHVWPTADQADEGFDATQVIWSFFKQHAH
ncbi:alpha/beta hydrolase family esterase [Acinetobacter guerrae]|uniref:alpha/beta hydrolase family esterase n=1 Tax=Acinetobacter guerrae TaxID=1843371 RepID=UPI00125FF58A|nr:PHB depolymerase family esterase [Acinetobacter guerrae]